MDGSIDVELQPLLVDHALPKRDLCIDEAFELLGCAVGREARHGLEALWVLASSSQAFIWPLSESTTGLGVPAGRKMPNHVETSNGFSSGMVSQIGTSSGVSGLRWAEVMPSARSLPARTKSMPVVRLSKKNWVTPAVRSCSAGAGAAIGNVLGLGAGELKEPGAGEVRRLAGARRGIGGLAILRLQ